MSHMQTRETRLRVLVLGYSGILAGIAGFINSVALLVLAFPVGNLTALSTQLGMDSANPLLYESCMIALIVGGFLAGAAGAGAVLATVQTHTSARHAAVLLAEAALLLAAAGIEIPGFKALLAAAACGLQNAMTSDFPGMTIRTTHFTGTITDLGLILGRSRHHGVDRWKATVLATTVVLFIGGGATGALIGGRLGHNALLLPAAACLAIAMAILWYSRRRSSRMASAISALEPAHAPLVDRAPAG
ncbi:DUF1275 family protein [Mycobacterium intracellulare]|jgi:uncharacterized membrane protein YoaK (UPF0700 family)|uniref:DUF1275 family protein n=2 Tax=Mycobacterium avium complex (MAC) TaxID=120793 RepID=A0ABN5ZT32_9MYCO|nr:MULTISPECIES: DUF1275 family protein [Mycobacterium]AFJ37296.1 hypothetical protein W7S_21735 [Mycobacterium sp. MOTT36Y]MCA4732023.1 DUF1275 domain-containing protein [Mycobacterium avium subsp. hominissuis]MCV7407551.1 DUF1275 domain-containing protein [Mycobacterium marseillense]MDO2360017.1 DUF1275 family protein [Mycobacterium avium subsp. hominissuis]ORA88429.1 DUF1275 family protein [Mycobacterium marseillense]